MGRTTTQNGPSPGDVVITIDGPAGSGKSTAARLLARRLGARLLETGALYRCVALAVERHGVDLSDEDAVVRVAESLNVGFLAGSQGARVKLAERDVTEELRAPRISQAASRVAAIPAVRQALLGLQHRLARGGVTVAEGRDLGTVVFPRATAKFYVVADEAVRAQRRHLEQVQKGDTTPLDEVKEDIKARDARDGKRAVAPMKPAPDAVMVDTSGLTPDQVVDLMLAEVWRRRPDLSRDVTDD
jgi:cytidylate kinase